MTNNPRPLRRRTLSLDQLQMVVLRLIRKVRNQMNRSAHEPGLSDSEFAEQVLDPLESMVRQDREILSNSE